MVWAKFPIAASVLTCAACLTVAAAVPAMTPAVRSLEAGVDLKVDTFIDFLNQDAYSAIPIYQLAQTNPLAIFALASLSGIPALLDYAATGNTDAFVPVDADPTADPPVAGQAGYAALSALSAYRDFNESGDINDLTGIDAYSGIPAYEAFAATGDINQLAAIDNFSAIPAYERLALGDRSALDVLASTSGLQSFERFQNGYVDPDPVTETNPGSSIPRGSFSAFVPADPDPITGNGGNNGYAALSGLASYQAYFNSNGSDMSLLNGIDAFSAIQRVPPPAPPSNPPPTTLTETTPQSNLRVATLTAPVETPAVADAPADDPAPVAKRVAKKGNGSYSGSFSPVGAPVLFGSGGGKNAADNGMRGYGGVANGLRKALGMGPDKSGAGAGSESGGSEGGGGDAG